MSKVLRRQYILILLTVLFSLVVLLPLFLQPLALPPRDSGVFLYTGWRIIEGDLPYRDIWDHKPPVIFYINALGLSIGNGSIIGVRGCEAVSLVTATILGYILLRKAFGEFLAFLGSLLWLLSLVLVLMGGNFTEEFALPLQFLALLSYIQAEKKGSHSWQGYVIGFTLGLVLLLRPNLVAIWVAIIIHIAFRGLQRNWRTIAKIITGFVAATGLVLLPLIIHNQFGSFWEAVFTYNFAYVATTTQNRLQAIGNGIEALSRSGLFILSSIGWLLIPFYIALHSSGLQRFKRSLLGVGLGAFPTEVVFSTISGRSYLHYYISWLPISSVLGTFALFVVSKFLHRSTQGRLLIVQIGSLVILACAAVQPIALLNQQFTDCVANSDSEDLALIEYIRRSTSHNEYVLVWGAEAGLNFLLQRQSPTRYVYQYPLFPSNPRYETAAEEFCRDIGARDPAFIVDTSPSNDRIPPIDRQARYDWFRMLEEHNRPVPDLSQLELFLRYVTDDYIPVGTMGRNKWLVYQHAPDLSERQLLN